MIDEQQILLGLSIAIITGSVIFWVYKKYKEIMADGVVTLDELIDVAEEGAEIILETLIEVNDLKGLGKMRKGDLIDLCVKHGLDDTGTRATLIARLKEL